MILILLFYCTYCILSINYLLMYYIIIYCIILLIVYIYYSLYIFIIHYLNTKQESKYDRDSELYLEAFAQLFFVYAK